LPRRGDSLPLCRKKRVLNFVNNPAAPP
jgi:hypothetical protein